MEKLRKPLIIQIGDCVDVINSKECECDFNGTVVGFDDEFILVVDSDDNVFSIEQDSIFMDGENL